MKICDFERNKRFTHSLKTQVILFYSVISLIIISVGSYFSYISIINILKKQNEKFLLQQFRQSEYNIQNVTEEADRLSLLLISDKDVQQYLQNEPNQSGAESIEIQKKALQKMRELIDNYKFISSIYLYTWDRRAIGISGSNTLITRAEDDNTFFLSSTYINAKDSFPNIIFEGGQSESYFNPNINNDENKLISVARGLKPTLGPYNVSTLVINIDERYFASIFAANTQSEEDYMYIVDNDGKIISSSDGENIGKISVAINNENLDDFGSFASNSTSEQIQVIYYKLSGTDWYLVGEIPLEAFRQDILVVQKVISIVLMINVITIMLITLFWMKKVMKPISILNEKMYNIGAGEFGITIKNIPKNELGHVIERFNEMSLNTEALVKQIEEIEQEKKRLEIEALQAQINPHFIYNTLNMIKWMAAVVKAKNIYDGIVAFGNLLRPIFKSKDTVCTIGEELEFLKNYIKIMNLRFASGVELCLNISQDVLDFNIPKFILQPIIENTITHGMTQQDNQIDIIIDIIKINNDLQIIVSDTGRGIPPDKVEEINAIFMMTNKHNQREDHSDGIGLYNVHRRLKLNFGDDYGISVDSKVEKGVRVVVRIPQKKKG